MVAEPTQMVLMQPEPQRNPPALTPLQLIQMATEKGADVATLERLMALNDRWEATQARKAFVEAMAAFKKHAPAIIKNKLVSFGSGNAKTAYYHATLDKICEVLIPALNEHGFSHRWNTEQVEGGQIRVTCILTHILGHAESVSMQSGADGSGSKNNIQALASATTYLSRYTLLMIIGLAAADQDTDGRAGADFITADQAAELNGMIDAMAKTLKGDFSVAAGRVMTRFLDAMQVESIERIPAKRFNEAKTKLSQPTRGVSQ